MFNFACSGTQTTDNKLRAYEVAEQLFSETAGLMKSYYKQHGKFPTDIFAVASVSVHPKSYLSDIAGLFGDEGVNIKIDSTGTKFTLIAHEKYYKQKVTVNGSK